MDFPCDMGWASSFNWEEPDIFITDGREHNSVNSGQRNRQVMRTNFKTPQLICIDHSRISDIESIGNNEVLIKLWSTIRSRTSDYLTGPLTRHTSGD